MRRIEEVESTHWLVQDNCLAGREAVAGGVLEDLVGEEEVEASDVVEDHVGPMGWEEAQDLAHLAFLPLFRRTSCLDRDRLTEELVETSPHFEEDRRCLGREGSHLEPQVRGGVVRFLRHTCEVSIFSLAIELRTLTSASRPNVSAP